MVSVRMTCEGVPIGPLYLPPFQLREREMLCLHLPELLDPKDEKRLEQALTGQPRQAGLNVHSRVLIARPAIKRNGLSGWFSRPTLRDWLAKNGAMTRSQISGVLSRWDLSPTWRIDQIAGNSRTQLRLELAWAKGAEVVVFSTYGLDPLGVEKVFERVAEQSDRCAAIYLSHLFKTAGLAARHCPPGGRCIEVKRSASLTDRKLGVGSISA